MENPMRALSPTDGSADAVREAADAALARDDNRLALERELDRDGGAPPRDDVLALVPAG